MRTLAAVVLLWWLGACGQVDAPQGAAPPASAIGRENASLHVEDAWAPPTPGGVDVSAGYLSIVNGADAADTLLGLESPRAERVEVHEMTMDGGVMQMRPAAPIVVGAHQHVRFAPGGLHLMFTGVKPAFSPGEQIPVDLSFAHAGTIRVMLRVRLPSQN